MPFITARRQRRLALIAAAAVLSITAAGCASTTSTSVVAANGSTGTGKPGVSAAAGVAHADAQVAAYSALATSFTAPGPSLHGMAAMRGGSITYIPLFLLAPYFQAVAGQLTKAAAQVGMTVHVCSANATPSGAASCFSQAIDEKTDGIITDALPYGYASNPYAAAAAAGIPVAALDIGDQPPAALAGHAATLSDGTDLEGVLLADSIIAASGGKADALLVVSTTNSESTENKDAMEQEFGQYCPDCKITEVIDNESDQTSGISLALARNPGIDYVVAQEDQPVGPVVQGILKQLDKKTITASQGGGLNGMQAVVAGTNLVDIGNDPAIAAWNAADLLFRLMTHAPAPASAKYTTLVRVFNKSDISSVSLTNSAFDSGSWYSNGSFEAMYTSLWTSEN